MDAESFALSDFRAVLWRGKWVFAIVAIAVPLGALLLSLNQSRLYEAKARVALNSRPLPSALTGSAPTATPSAPSAQRYVQTQAILAETMPVAESAIDEAGLTDRSARDLLSASGVTANPSADILVFTVEDGDRADAASLATAYAQAFVEYRAALDTRAALRILDEMEGDLAEIEPLLSTAPDSDLPALDRSYAVLIEQRQGLKSYLAVREQDALLASPADTATLVRPKTARNVLLGIGLGLVFGVVAAFLYDALFPRIRSHHEIETVLRVPILARLPAPPRSSARSLDPVLLTRPQSFQAEAVRILRAKLALLGGNGSTLMFSSAIQQEGKSTTVANLGVAFAQFGSRIALIDLDLNHPNLHRFFDFEQAPGALDVLSGGVTLAAALRQVELPHSPKGMNGLMPDPGELHVLPLGSADDNAAWFLGSPVLEALFDDLRRVADIVLIDTGPLLGVSHPIVLSSKIDALVIVLRPDMVSPRDLHEMREVIESLPPRKVGVILTNVKGESPYPLEQSRVEWEESSIAQRVKEHLQRS